MTFDAYYIALRAILINFVMEMKNHGGESDQDEGFVENVPEINEEQKGQEVEMSRERPRDYQARYISSHGLIRYLPQQTGRNYQNCWRLFRTFPKRIQSGTTTSRAAS